MSTESDLNTHIELCALRYKGIEEKFDQVEKRLDKMAEGLEDIKHMIAKNKASNFNAVMAAAGVVISALITFLGYLLTHIK